MTAFERLTATVLAVALAGCAEMKALDDKAMNQFLAQKGQTGQLQPEQWAGEVVVPAEAQCGFSERYKQMHNCCVMKRYTTAIDVDTAFAKAMQEYGFSEKKPPGEGAGYPHYHGHDFTAQPGALYRMFGDVVPHSDVRLSRGVWMGLVIAKAGPNSAQVESVYCEARGRRMRDQLTWHKAMQESIRATLPPVSTSKS